MTLIKRVFTEICEDNSKFQVADSGQLGIEDNSSLAKQIKSYLKSSVSDTLFIIGTDSGEYTSHMPEFKALKDTKVSDEMYGTYVLGKITANGKSVAAIEFTSSGSDKDESKVYWYAVKSSDAKSLGNLSYTD